MTPLKDLVAVSVIIPCYRCAGTIERAIASVAAQTWRPAEVILVDDASGDETREVLTKISQQFDPSWIKLIFLDHNVGAGSARNAGWAAASQQLIAFLDADDAWHSRKIEMQCGYMAAHPEVALCGHSYRVVKKNLQPNWSVSQESAQPVSKLIMFLSNRFVTPSVMVRRDVAYRFLPGQRYVDDHMLWLQIICSGARVMKLPIELVAIYKELYGVTGLSSRVWLMERSELGNYRRLQKNGYISRAQLTILVSYSLLKFIRRLVVYWGYLRWKK